MTLTSLALLEVGLFNPEFSLHMGFQERKSHDWWEIIVILMFWVPTKYTSLYDIKNKPVALIAHAF